MRASPDAAISAAAHDALVGAITVGDLAFTGFGTSALQALGVTQADAAYTAALAGIPDGFTKDQGSQSGKLPRRRFLS